MTITKPTTDELCVNTIRNLALDAVQTANSGHLGLPLGAAAMGYALWTRHMRFNPKNPHWFNRDRFILSAGHGCMLQYALLYLTGFDLSIDDLKHFRKMHSRTPGHPENTHTPGVEMATGPLGQGIAHSVGFAIAEKFLAATFNKPGFELIDHYTFGICSDGDMMEGVSNEAASLAGHLKLGKLIFLYDDNGITIDGKTEITFTENVGDRFKALGWHTQTIDGLDVQAVDNALKIAKKVTDQPSLILCKTIIGFGSPHLEGTNKIHSNPLKPEELILTKENLGLPTESTFAVSEEALKEFRKSVDKGLKEESAWNEMFASYKQKYPELAKTLKDAIDGDFGDAWIKALPVCKEKIATRKAGTNAIQAIYPHLPTLIGGSADLVESNFTHQDGRPDFEPKTPEGPNINFGIREHAMIAAVNGIMRHGGLKAYGSSFMVFTDYARPSLRLAAIMECPSIFVFTHDSVGVGEDGPTHQPIEQFTSLRAIPNFNVIRPADGNETAAAWKVAMQSTKTPTLLGLSRQALPAITPDDVQNHPLEKGAYILKKSSIGAPQLNLIGTGSEVQLCLSAQARLEELGVPTQVVSMPSWFLFESQDEEYKKSVIDRSIKTLSVEAGSTLAWPRYSDAQVGIDRFGISGPGDLVMAELGMNVENVVAKAQQLLGIG